MRATLSPLPLFPLPLGELGVKKWRARVNLAGRRVRVRPSRSRNSENEGPLKKNASTESHHTTAAAGPPGGSGSVMSAFLGLTKGIEEAFLCRVVLRRPI